MRITRLLLRRLFLKVVTFVRDPPYRIRTETLNQQDHIISAGKRVASFLIGTALNIAVKTKK